MDFMDLVELVVAWEERKEGQDLKVDAAYAPVVHLVIVVPVCEEALGWAVPTRADVLCEGWLRVDPATRAEVRQLDLVFLEQNVLSVSS